MTLQDFSEAMRLGASTIHEASGGLGALPSAIKPIDVKSRIAGRTFTVSGPGGDNLWIHRALLAAQPGDVLVCTVESAFEHGYWGEILTVAAMEKRVSGLVIDGSVRDAGQIEALGFPVFCRGLCIRGTSKRHDGTGSVGSSVTIGNVSVSTGDLIVGDRDGVVVIPGHLAHATLIAAKAREAKEADILRRLRAGENTLEIYGWR
jgi:4-hydroxy-4-methyl-2-oxoglutarate aldolase